MRIRPDPGAGAFRVAPLMLSGIALLQACAAPTPARYSKEGATEQEFIAVRNACTATVKQQFNPYEDFGSPVYRSSQSEKMIGARLEVDRLLRECMESRGWHEVREKPGE